MKARPPLAERALKKIPCQNDMGIMHEDAYFKQLSYCRLRVSLPQEKLSSLLSYTRLF